MLLRTRGSFLRIKNMVRDLLGIPLFLGIGVCRLDTASVSPTAAKRHAKILSKLISLACLMLSHVSTAAVASMVGRPPAQTSGVCKVKTVLRLRQ